ncbi:ZFY27-like protein [Mya arenaria]|uniref:ZFY27-like protein n=1 Tax=Mya arenaria TaxID=6604 RepID=A0ABY7FGR6_MYAAR|nr:ZFY27-like protein [Mya arenaria]
MEEEISNGIHGNAGAPAGQVDIARFVAEVEQFNTMTEPFAFLLYIWDDLRRSKISSKTFWRIFTRKKESGISESCNGDVGSQLDRSESMPLTDSDKLCDTGQDDIEEIEDDQITSSDNSKPGMVARLLEMKRRRKLIASGMYTCCHCGNNFCSKCCNQKVPKSFLGATAPSAQTELVLVCTVCHKLLQDEAAGKEKAITSHVEGFSQRKIYTLHTEAKTWNEAHAVCEDQQGHLIKVKDGRELGELLFLDTPEGDWNGQLASL